MKLQWSLSLMGLELVNKKLEFLPLHSMPMQEPISHHHIFRGASSQVFRHWWRLRLDRQRQPMTQGALMPEKRKWKICKWAGKIRDEHIFGGDICCPFFLSDANSWLEYHYPKIILRSTWAMKTSKRGLGEFEFSRSLWYLGKFNLNFSALFF